MCSANHLASRTHEVRMSAVHVAVVKQRPAQRSKAVDLRRKLVGDLGFEKLDVVGEVERNIGEANRRTDLLGQFKIFPAKSELANQLCQRALFRSLASKVGHRVQSDVVVTPAHAIKRIQAADRVMTFENTDPLIKVGQSDAGSQAAHSRADDDRVVFRTHANRERAAADVAAHRSRDRNALQNTSEDGIRQRGPFPPVAGGINICRMVDSGVQESAQRLRWHRLTGST